MIKLQRTTDRVNSNGVHVLVGTLLDRIDFDGAAYSVRLGGHARRQALNSTCLRAYIGLLAEGRTAFEEVEQYRGDDFFREALSSACAR